MERETRFRSEVNAMCNVNKFSFFAPRGRNGQAPGNSQVPENNNR